MSKSINLFYDSDKLEGTKYYKTWQRLIKITLIYNELWHDICDGDIKPNKPTYAATLEKWEVKNGKALALIKSSVNDEMYVHIENATDAWSALQIFKDFFDTQPESKKFDLQLKLLQQKLTEGGDVLEYFSRLKNIKQEIINVGFQAVDDSFMVTILIVGLPSSYTHFLETLQLTGKLEKLKFDELCEMLTQHDKTFGKKKKVGEDVFFTEANTSKSSTNSSRKRGRGNFNQNQAAHNVQSRGRSQSRGNNFNNGNNLGRSNFQGRGNSQGRGYFQRRGNNNQGRGQLQNRIQSRDRGQSLGRGRDLSQIVCRRCNKVGHYAEDCRTSIDKIPKFHQHSTQFANDQDDDISKYFFTSSLTLQLSSHLKSEYEDAWILDSRATQHMTCQRDFFWNFQDCHLNSIFLADDTKHTPYAKGVVKVYLPSIREKMISNVWYVTTFKNNLLYLVMIQQEGRQVIMVDGLVKINSVKHSLQTVMTGYEDGKLLRIKGTVIPRHSNFAGAVTIEISPIRLWHQKLEAFEKFKIFRQLVENEVKEKIGTLRTNNGGEFTSNEFKTYCNDNGIIRHLTNVYTPQQNGVVERMNQTLLGMARSMLTFKKSIPTYWAEAIHIVVYLRNRSTTASLDEITPYEAWFGFKPRVKHLRVFGSICYALVPKEKITKLDSRSLKCTMIGYSDEKKGYRLLTKGKFIVGRDVIFYETESKSAKEIENLLQKLESKGIQRKGNMKS
eukprot:PITA_33744